MFNLVVLCFAGPTLPIEMHRSIVLWVWALKVLWLPQQGSNYNLLHMSIVCFILYVFKHATLSMLQHAKVAKYRSCF